MKYNLYEIARKTIDDMESAGKGFVLVTDGKTVTTKFSFAEAAGLLEVAKFDILFQERIRPDRLK